MVRVIPLTTLTSQNTSIFELHKKLSRVPSDLQSLCYEYSRGDIQRWYKFVENIDKVKAKYDNYICDYDKSVVVDKEVTFPVTSSFIETTHEEQGLNWVWSRKDGKNKFAFDSYAEKEWAAKLRELAYKRKYISELEMPGVDEDDELFLWGKNYPLNSEIKYEYYANGIHASYPDFVMKDKLGRIHIFEVKSVNVAVGTRPLPPPPSAGASWRVKEFVFSDSVSLWGMCSYFRQYVFQNILVAHELKTVAGICELCGGLGGIVEVEGTFRVDV